MPTALITYLDRAYEVGYKTGKDEIEIYSIINERGTEIFHVLERLSERGTPKVMEWAIITLLHFEDKVLDHIDYEANKPPLAELLDLENF